MGAAVGGIMRLVKKKQMLAGLWGRLVEEDGGMLVEAGGGRGEACLVVQWKKFRVLVTGALPVAPCCPKCLVCVHLQPRRTSVAPGNQDPC